jgi:hypothetical protein
MGARIRPPVDPAMTEKNSPPARRKKREKGFYLVTGASSGLSPSPRPDDESAPEHCIDVRMRNPFAPAKTKQNRLPANS